ncbi:MAG: hypothetical protein NVSMB29_09520 [Candidatus Dormibacteria bacterium]
MTGRADTRVLPWPLLLAGALLIGFLVLPFLALLGALPQADRSSLGDGGAANALGISLIAATVATGIDAALGIPLGLWLARTRSRARHLVTGAVLLPLAVPPVVGGLELILLLGPNGWLGAQLARVGLNPLDTIAGTVLAQMFVAAPFVVISARTAFEAVDPTVGEAARVLGCGPGATLVRALIPSARRGIVAGLVLGWVRCLGEFGATAVLAYHPYTLPTLTYVNLSGQGLSTALPVGGVLAAAGALVATSLLWLDARSTSRLRRTQESGIPDVVSELDWVGAAAHGSSEIRVRAAVQVGGFELDIAFASGSPAVAILGPSGAGKSLTLRTMTGLLRPAVGTVSIGDAVLLDTGEGIDVAPEHRGLGYVAQRDGLLDHLDVEANIRFGLSRVAAAERSRRVSELLAATGLTRVRNQRPQTLSAGERQRVALARALAPGPRALLLDEPFSNLDTPVRHQLRRLVREIHERTNLPLVLVTHDLEDALEIADHVVILERGQVVQQGPIGVVFARPARSSVARLVGIPNVLSIRGLEPESAATVRVDTSWGSLGVEAPADRASTWQLAVPIDAIFAGPTGATALIHACRPAPGGWRLILTSPAGGEPLEALLPADTLASRPIVGGTLRVTLTGERCFLMPRQPALPAQSNGAGSAPAAVTVAEEKQASG